LILWFAPAKIFEHVRERHEKGCQNNDHEKAGLGPEDLAENIGEDNAQHRS
jgi:hypothetical protein